MATCNTSLPNLGQSCPLKMGEIVRIGFVSTKKENGTNNSIALADAAAIANWQTLFHKNNFDADVLEKVVMTQRVYGLVDEQGDAVTYDENGYYKKLRDGDKTITFMVNSEVADYINQLKKLEDNQLSMYFFDDNTRAWGRSDGTNLIPVDIQNINVPDFKLQGFDSISQVAVVIRLKTPSQMNSLKSVAVADGDIFDDDDFYSMDDVSGVVTSPAVTGCVVALTSDRDDSVISGLAESGSTDYTNWVFYDAVAPTVPISLAADTSITETPNGTYTINEAALLTTGHTYSLKISANRYDIDVLTVVVP